MTPSKWLRHARLMHAIIRLAAGEKVGTVALDVGYDSPSAFSFMFRQLVGKSPREFGRIPETGLGE
jgi:methylphosphotriester-DNA--protein-cysteine methyltransferase